jgi:hypothetical protein
MYFNSTMELVEAINSARFEMLLKVKIFWNVNAVSLEIN